MRFTAFLALLASAVAAFGQIAVRDKDLSMYPFAGESARLHIPHVNAGTDSATAKINRTILFYSFLRDSSMWNDIFADSSFTRLGDTSTHATYQVFLINEYILNLQLQSDFHYEPYPQVHTLWFDMKTGDRLGPEQIFSAKGMELLKDRLRHASEVFERKNRKIIKEYYSDYNFIQECTGNIYGAISSMNYNKDKKSLSVNYLCSVTMSCDLFGPNGTFVFQRDELPLILRPEIFQALKMN